MRALHSAPPILLWASSCLGGDDLGLWVTWLGPSSDRASFGDLLPAESKAQKSLARSCVPSARRGGYLGVGFRITSRLVKLAKGGQLAGAWGVHIRLVVPTPAPGARDTRGLCLALCCHQASSEKPPWPIALPVIGMDLSSLVTSNHPLFIASSTVHFKAV